MAWFERIEALRRQGLTGKAIAAEVGVSPATVSRVLKRMGLNRLSALEPAEWVLAVIAVLAAGFGIFTDLLSWGLSHLPFHLGDTADSANRSVFLIFLGLAFVIILVIFASRVWDAHRAASWKQAQGKILTATSQIVTTQFEGEAPQETTKPQVEYEFSVNGRTIRGSQIDVGGEGGGVDAVLARYTPGMTVPVFYDPADPHNCALERERPREMISGCAALIAVVAAVGVTLYWVIKVAYHILSRNPRAYPHLAIIAAIFGVLGVMAFFGSRKMRRDPHASGVTVYVNQEPVTYSAASVGAYDWSGLVIAAIAFGVAIFASGAFR